MSIWSKLNGIASDAAEFVGRIFVKGLPTGGLGAAEEVGRQIVETGGKIVGAIHTMSDYKGRDLSGLGDLRAGDVLVKYSDGTRTNFTIKSIQKEDPTSAYWFVHAALVTDRFSTLHALEMSGEGLVCNDLAGHNRDFEYEVFRAKNSKIRDEAATLIGGLAAHGQREKSAEYNYLELLKLVADLDRMVTEEEFDVGYRRMIEGRHTEKFFCSQFVAWLYQGAKYRSRQPDTLWSISSVHIGPPRLAKEMKFRFPQSWEHVGYLPAGKR